MPTFPLASVNVKTRLLGGVVVNVTDGTVKTVVIAPVMKFVAVVVKEPKTDAPPNVAAVIAAPGKKPVAETYTVLPEIPEPGEMFTTGLVTVKVADALLPASSETTIKY